MPERQVDVLKVLVMEDEAILGRNIKSTLEKSGVDVIHANSANAAREALTTRRFDLVLADITLGDGNGFDVLSEFHDMLEDTPIVMMTGQDSLANRMRAETIDVAAFLAKPFTLSRVRELVAALICHSTGTSGTVSRGYRVAMYSHDTIGLGHMRRNSAIARELVARVPGVSVLMLVGCPAGMVFEPHPGIDYVKLPSLAKLTRSVWQPSSLRTDPETTRAMRVGIIEQVLKTLAPDVLLVDHEPAGVWDELVSSLERLRQSGRTRVILGLRDILDDPDRVAQKWKKNGTGSVIENLYDEIFVYGNPGFYPSIDAYDLDRLRIGAVNYCGIATSAKVQKTRSGSRRPRRVLVAGGGGRDAYLLIATALAAQKLIPRRRRPEMTVVTGPLMDEELHDDLMQQAQAAGVVLLRSIGDFPQLLCDADLFVSMAGYNSVNECLAVGCPAIVVPRVGPSSEQRLRAKRLSELGLARVLEHEELDAQVMARMIQAPLKAAPDSQSLSFTGAQVAACLIADRLGTRALSGNPLDVSEYAHVD